MKPSYKNVLLLIVCSYKYSLPWTHLVITVLTVFCPTMKLKGIFFSFNGICIWKTWRALGSTSCRRFLNNYSLHRIKGNLHTCILEHRTLCLDWDLVIDADIIQYLFLLASFFSVKYLIENHSLSEALQCSWHCSASYLIISTTWS